MEISQEDKKIFVNLTENQAKLLRTVMVEITPTSGASGLSGHGLGRVASSLEQKGFITPMGKKDRQYKWQLTDEWENKVKRTEYKNMVMDMLNKIAGMK